MSHETNTPILTPKVTKMATSVLTYYPYVNTDVAIIVIMGVKNGVFD